MDKLWRRSAVVAAAVVVSAIAAVPPETVSAAVTATTVTSVTGVPAGYTIDDEDGSPSSQPTVTATGTATAAVGDQVDVRCYYSDDGQDDFALLEGGVPVTSGTWTASGPLSNIAGYSCRLIAVPAGSTFVLDDPSSAAFGLSQLLTVGEAFTDTTTGATPFSDYLVLGSRMADNELDAADTCGPYSTLMSSVPHRGDYLWNCMVDLFPGDGGNDGHAQDTDPVRIGGHSAQTGVSIKEEGPGLPLSQGGLRYSYQQNKSTGDVVVMEADPYYFCETAAHSIDDTVGATDCASWLYTGVTLHRTYHIDHGGQAITIADQFVSTGKAKLSLSLEYENNLEHASSTVRLPGSGAYTAFAAGAIDTSSWPADGSLSVRDDPAVHGGSVDSPIGSLTWSTRPTSARVFIPSELQPDVELFLNYTRTLAAHGSFTLTYRLVMTASAATLGSLTSTNRMANLPRVRLRHLPAKTTKRALTVRGTVVDGGNGPITKVLATVGHRHYRAAVRHGVFTLHVRLKRGVDHIAVVGIDPAHQKATGKATIRYKPRKRRH